MNGVYQATVETAKAYIDQNLGRDLSVEKLAAVTGYSVSRFAHIFQEQTQMSVKEYVTEQRLYQAAKMILEGETIVNAALECGFDTHSGFAKADGVSAVLFGNAQEACGESQTVHEALKAAAGISQYGIYAKYR